MKNEFENELSPEVRAKMKKNLIYVIIFAITMFFAALSSAYIISMGDSIWITVPLSSYPKSFWISTILIFLSSIFIEISIRSAKNKNAKGIRISILMTLALGLSFILFQYKGWEKLSENGIMLNTKILVEKGIYGESYKIKMDNKTIHVDGNDYQFEFSKRVKRVNKYTLIDTNNQKNSSDSLVFTYKKLTPNQFSDLQSFMKQFYPQNFPETKEGKHPELTTWSRNSKIHKFKKNKRFKLFLNDKPISIVNGHLYTNDTTKVKSQDIEDLYELSRNIMQNRGVFFPKGTMGIDFNVYLRGDELLYKNGKLYRKKNNQELPEREVTNMRKVDNKGSQFMIGLIFLHCLHILLAIFYLLRLNIKAFNGAFDSGDYLKLKIGAIFWHFLGFLWVYLILFLLFIH
ncbi:MAG: hypothetical protein P8I93_04430 [Crocinitomicaceae bacterium]|nr:hypothetical protein [Crocinitomicaceae bacterium]